jgi:hypothetical protein
MAVQEPAGDQQVASVQPKKKAFRKKFGGSGCSGIGAFGSNGGVLPCRAGQGWIRPELQALLKWSCRHRLHQALQLVGKLEPPGQLKTVAPGLLVFIQD